MRKNKLSAALKSIPQKCGVYLFLDGRGKIIYVGKAADLKNRVRSYFKKTGPQSPLKSVLPEKIAKIKWRRTDSEIEALILEANLIKKYRPDFNISLKDSSDYFYVGITKELFPKVFITHQNTKYKIQNTKYQIPKFIGPFTDGTALKKTLQIIRKIFPFCTCRHPHKRPCLNSEMGRCLGICCLKPQLAANQPNFKENLKKNRQNIAALKKVIAGKKKKLVSDLNREMRKAAAGENFEKAGTLRDQIENLRKIFSHEKILLPERAPTDWPKINRLIQKLFQDRRNFKRIEAYDISHISGKHSVGAMVVFKKGKANPVYQPRSRTFGLLRDFASAKYRKKRGERSERSPAPSPAAISAGLYYGASPEDYRRFKIKSARKQDDPAMLKEIIGRRLRHLDWPLPDLILIDGGKPQLGAVLAVLKENRLNIAAAALAKGKNELHLLNLKKPKRLNSLKPELKLFFLRIRDQAHRFAVKYHRKLRKRGLLNDDKDV